MAHPIRCHGGARSRGCLSLAIQLMLAAMPCVGLVSPGHAATRDVAVVYAALGPDLHVFELDVPAATLTEKSVVTLPHDVQAGRASRSGRNLYVAWSDGTGSTPGTVHGLSAFRLDAASLSLQPITAPLALASRPIYVTSDRPDRHVMVVYTSPSAITVHPVAADGAAGAPLPQPPLDLGIYAHQVLIDPSNTRAILAARGNVPNASRAEDPGALDVLSYRNGRFAPRGVVAPAGGYGFHPRYVDFHPGKPWVYVSLSQQNEIGVYAMKHDGSLSNERLAERNSLADPAHVQAGQLTGALHVHPNGRFVYLVNRSTNAARVDGKPVFSGGENSIAVFAIHPRSGEPTLIQTIDSQGIGPVEFSFDPSGRLLLVANMLHLWIRDPQTQALAPVAPNLAVFRVGRDGRLQFVRKVELESGERTLFWMGVSARP